MIGIDVDAFDVGRVWEGAVRLLGKVGVLIQDERLRRKLSQSLPFKDDRVLFPRDVIEHFAEEIKAQSPPPKPPSTAQKVTLGNSRFSHDYLDPHTGRVRPFDTPTLIKYARLAYQLRREGMLSAAMVGYPLDVAPELQLLISTYLDCCYSDAPHPISLAQTRASVRFLFEISRVMGFKPAVGNEIISPLKLIGSSLDIAIDFFELQPRISIDPLPVMGVTAPLEWHAAWAQSVAENVSSYVAFRLYGFEDVGLPSFRLFLPNMATGMIHFSAPQSIVALLTRRKVREWFHLPTASCEFMLVSPRLPGQQAMLEKTIGCLMAKLHGFTFVEGAGNLFLDEVFSPQQLMLDIEIKHFVESIDPTIEADAQDIVDAVRAGVDAGSFLATDLTLGKYKDFLWRPVVFNLADRDSTDWQTVMDRANAMAEEKITQYDYELTGEKRAALDAIMVRARKGLSQ